MERPVVSVDFCDLGSKQSKTEHWLLKVLQERFDVRLTTSPDFIFYGDGGDVHRMYTCKRVYVGRADVDFAECDYAVVVTENGKAARDSRVLKITSAAEISNAEKEEVLSFFAKVFSETREPIAAKKRMLGRWVLVRKNL